MSARDVQRSLHSNMDGLKHTPITLDGYAYDEFTFQYGQIKT